MSGTITTIVPTYRRAQLLRRALRSVLRQTYGDFRVCIYDNASDDDTSDVARDLAAGDSRVAYFRHPANIGGAANFLFGMKRVDTPYFSFLSDDDVLLPDFFETAIAGFTRAPGALMSAASTIEVDERGAPLFEPLALWNRDGVFEPPSGAFAMLDNRHPTWTTALFRREAIDSVGLLDLDVGAPSDLDFELHLAACAPIVVSRRACGAYVRHSSAESMAETAAVARGFERMWHKVEEDERIEPAERARLVERLRRQLRWKLVEIWVKSLVRGDGAAALDAAVSMRDRYGPRTAGSLLVAAWRACTQIGACRAALRALENARLRMRAGPSRTVEPRRLVQIKEALAL